MQWSSAHAVMYLKWPGVTQDQFVVLENVFLIQAPDRAAAFTLALERAKLEEESQRLKTGLAGMSTSTPLTGLSGSRPCAGIRKVVALLHLSPPRTSSLTETELTYNQLSFRSEAEVLAFADGADMSVRLDDQLSQPEGTPRW